MGGDPILFLIASVFLIPAVLIAIPVHELGHALAAYFMGDPSPRNRGFFRPEPRLFLNVYGVLAAFLANVGFGTPVPVNEYRLQSVISRLAYALGGPVANLVVGGIFGVVVRILFAAGAPPLFSNFSQSPLSLLTTICYAIFFLNLSTMAFNLLPIPGLDGWRVIEALFRQRNPRFFFDVHNNRQTIWAIAALIIFVGPLLLRFSVLNVVVGIFFEPASLAIVGTCARYVQLQPCPL